MKSNENAKRTPRQEIKRLPETLEERVHRHITDINSKITDDDIKSVRTELDIRKKSTDLPKPDDTGEKKQKRKAGRHKKDSNKNGSEKHGKPWDLLSEGYE